MDRRALELDELLDHAATRGDRLALIDGSTGVEWSYLQATQASALIAERLEALGVGPGDRLLVRSFTCLPAVLCCWAAWRLGAVPVPVDPSWPPYLLDPVLALVAPRLALHAGGAARAPDCRSMLLADEEGRPSAPFLEWLRPRTLAAGGARRMPDAAPGAILFTSGSTGVPKGVVLSRGALARSARLVADTFGWRERDRFLNLGDLHAMSGLRNTCLAPAACGAAAILTPPAARAHAFGVQDCLQRHRATGLGAGPALVGAVLKLRDRLSPEAWRAPLLCTGGNLAAAAARDFQAWAGHAPINYYGLTETTGICIAHTPESAQAADGSLGWPVGARCLILDGAGRELPPGEAGELTVTGPNLMLGYLGCPELTAEAMRGGAFHTGDQARTRPDGRLELVGRIHNAIKTPHTDLLFPEEVEAALGGHPGLWDAAAVGVPSPAGGDHMVAFLVALGTVEQPHRFTGEIHQYLRDRLGPRRLPNRYRIVASIPRLAGGKIDRQALLCEATHDED